MCITRLRSNRDARLVNFLGQRFHVYIRSNGSHVIKWQSRLIMVKNSFERKSRSPLRLNALTLLQ